MATTPWAPQYSPLSRRFIHHCQESVCPCVENAYWCPLIILLLEFESPKYSFSYVPSAIISWHGAEGELRLSLPGSTVVLRGQERRCRQFTSVYLIGCFIFHHLKGKAKPIWNIMLLYILRHLAQKSEYSDVIWSEAIIFKIWIENGHINTTKKWKIFKWPLSIHQMT